jgi:hypothetical protein
MTKLTKEDFVFDWDDIESMEGDTMDMSLREVTKDVFDEVVGAYDAEHRAYHVFYEDEFAGMKRYLAVEKVDGNTRVQVAEYDGRYFYGYWYADEPDYVLDQKNLMTPSDIWEHDSEVRREIAASGR